MLEDIGLQRFSKIIKSQDHSKMHKVSTLLVPSFKQWTNLQCWFLSHLKTVKLTHVNYSIEE